MGDGIHFSSHHAAFPVNEKKRRGDRVPEILWHIKPLFTFQKFFLHRRYTLETGNTESLDFAPILEENQPPFCTISKQTLEEKKTQTNHNTTTSFSSSKFTRHIDLGKDYYKKVQVEFNPKYKIQDVSSIPCSRFT